MASRREIQNDLEQQRRASHQPSSVVQTNISGKLVYRCYSRQNEDVKSKGE